MPNVTYITFNKSNGKFSHFVNTTDMINNNSNSYNNQTNDNNVLVVFETSNVGVGASGIQFQSSISIAFMVMSWAFMLLGFSFCCCSQLCERKRNLCETQIDNQNQTQNNHNSNQNNINNNFHNNYNPNLNFFENDTESDRTSNSDQSEIIRRLDLDMESLPSYTIVSGLPTYDDALEEFRKAGIILTPNIPMVKLFDNSGKEATLDSNTDIDPNNMDNISTNSVCTCGASNSNLSTAGIAAPTASNTNQNVIELNPDQLRQLSQKRLSLQINFTPPRRNSRPRIDLYREVSRNNMLRAMGGGFDFPEIHRSASVMTLNNERSLLEQRLRHLQHRGSLT